MVLQGDFKSAETELNQAGDLNREIGSPRLEIDIHNAYTKMLTQQGKLKEAGEHQQSALRIAQNIGGRISDPDLRSDLLMAKSEIRSSKGKNDEH